MTCEHGRLNVEAEKMNRFGVCQRNDLLIMEGFHIGAVPMARLIIMIAGLVDRKT